MTVTVDQIIIKRVDAPHFSDQYATHIATVTCPGFEIKIPVVKLVNKRGPDGNYMVKGFVREHVVRTMVDVKHVIAHQITSSAEVADEMQPIIVEA